jgi:general secretion pathway protein J
MTNHHKSGFTLVEVILALALTTLLLGLLSSGVFIVAGDWNRNADVLDESLDEALAVLQIERALHGAFPHSYTNTETLSRQLFFSGESDYLGWVSTVSPQRTPGLTAWELFNVEDEGVYLTLVPAFSDDPSLRLQEAEPMLIFPDYQIEFSYLYEELDENRLWSEEWEAEELLSLPLAVYVRLEPYDEDEEVLEVLARVRNNLHRSIQANTAGQRAL